MNLVEATMEGVKTPVLKLLGRDYAPNCSGIIAVEGVDALRQRFADLICRNNPEQLGERIVFRRDIIDENGYVRNKGFTINFQEPGLRQLAENIHSILLEFQFLQRPIERLPYFLDSLMKLK